MWLNIALREVCFAQASDVKILCVLNGVLAEKRERGGGLVGADREREGGTGRNSGRGDRETEERKRGERGRERGRREGGSE